MFYVVTLKTKMILVPLPEIRILQFGPKKKLCRPIPLARSRQKFHTIEMMYFDVNNCIVYTITFFLDTNHPPLEEPT